MRWVLVVLGCLVLVGVLAVIVGSLLPKGHVVSRQVHLRQPVATVFDLISDFEAAPKWRSDVKKVDLLPARDGRTTFKEFGKNGPLVMTVEERTPPSRLVTRIVDQSSFGGTWTYELTGEGAECRLTITERGEVYSPIFRLLSSLFFSPTATMERYLVDLGRHFGEPATPR